MTTPTFAGLYAQLYDTFYQEKDTASEIDLVEEAIVQYLGVRGKKRLLEVGCGTGRLLAELKARGGYDLHGIDVSPAMIEQARAKHPKIDFKVADVRNFHSFRKFQVVLMYFNVVGYLLSDVDIIRSLQNICNSLVNGGILIMDWWDTEMVVKYPPVITKHQYKTESGQAVERIAIPSTASNSIINIEYVVELGHSASSQGLIETSRHQVRHFSKEELSFYVSEAGLYPENLMIPPPRSIVMDESRNILQENPLPGVRVNLVSYEDPQGWILGKFARKLKEHLTNLGVDAWISREPQAKFDVNHHIIYFDFNGKYYPCNTVMVTHIDHPAKLARLRYQEPQTRMFVCMSDEMVRTLGRVLPSEKLCRIHAGRNEDMAPRRLKLGIFTKIHDDGRKNERFILDVLPEIGSDTFEFYLMGNGWDKFLPEFHRHGFAVKWEPGFSPELYREWLPQMDYFLYFGWDEGSMAWIDAVACGVKVIATPQGYHMDVPNGINHVIQTSADLIRWLKMIEYDRLELAGRVRDWTWENYAAQHLRMWKELLK